jgi:hypothetical protein
LWTTNHNWGYVMLTNDQELASQFVQAFQEVWRLHVLHGLSAAVYTQTADVETECNGLQTYDRAVAKIDPAILRSANHDTFTSVPMKIILPDGLSGGANWKYTTNDPAENWSSPGFVPAAWADGTGGFASTGTPGVTLNTVWDTPDIWLRREFTLLPGELGKIQLRVFHDEDIEVYLNGVPALKLGGFITDYAEFDITRAALAALHPGSNAIAVHCHNTAGGQGVDVGILTPEKK